MSAALARTIPVSREIGDIRQLIAQNTDPDNGLMIDADRVEVLLRRLALIQRLIANLEHEVAAYRVARDGDAVSAMLGEEALAILGGGIVDAAGADVIRPQFGGRKS